MSFPTRYCSPAYELTDSSGHTCSSESISPSGQCPYVPPPRRLRPPRSRLTVRRPTQTASSARPDSSTRRPVCASSHECASRSLSLVADLAGGRWQSSRRYSVGARDCSRPEFRAGSASRSRCSGECQSGPVRAGGGRPCPRSGSGRSIPGPAGAGLCARWRAYRGALLSHRKALQSRREASQSGEPLGSLRAEPRNGKRKKTVRLAAYSPGRTRTCARRIMSSPRLLISSNHGPVNTGEVRSDQVRFAQLGTRGYP